nr:MAG TPA: Single strand binding protein [Caudoviricetes sp.]
MINNVTLVGRLVAPPDLRKTPNNVSSLQGTLAVNRNFKNENGDREADFIQFQAWRGTADIIAQYCSKGSLIGLTGRLQVRSYEKDGQRRYVTEVVAERFQLLESKGDNQGQAQQNAAPNFARNNNQQGVTNPLDISDDDLPF